MRTRIYIAWCILGSIQCSCSDKDSKPDDSRSIDPASSHAPPGVILITLDTCRADRLSMYGNQRIRTPTLDRLAAQGTVFERAFTPIPSTLPSHCTMMTGTYPSRHGVHDNGVYRLEDSAATLAERLKEQGFATGAFVSAFVLDRRFGIAQGFETYDDAMEDPLARDDPARIQQDPRLSDEQKKWFTRTATRFQRRAGAVTQKAIAWLGEVGERPFFLWLHCFDAHQPYQPPPPWDRQYDPEYRGELDGDMNTFFRVAAKNRWTPKTLPEAERQHMVALYDGEISAIDVALGELIRRLDSLGRASTTLIIVVGDHGEGFGEHEQIWEHNTEIFDEVVHVPLIVKDPRRGRGGQRAAGLVRSFDLAPTILEWAGASALPDSEGVSLLPLLIDPAAPSGGEVLLEARRKLQVHPAQQTPLLGLRDASYKLILWLDADEKPIKRELFDLALDPKETRPYVDGTGDPAAAEKSRIIDRMERRLFELERRSTAGRTSLPTRSLADVDVDALEAIGYLPGDKTKKDDGSSDH